MYIYPHIYTKTFYKKLKQRQCVHTKQHRNRMSHGKIHTFVYAICILVSAVFTSYFVLKLRYVKCEVFVLEI